VKIPRTFLLYFITFFAVAVIVSALSTVIFFEITNLDYSNKFLLKAGGTTIAVAIPLIVIACFFLLRRIHPHAHQQEKIFHALVETANEALLLINAKGIIQFVNPAAEKLFGYDKTEILGKNIKLLTPPLQNTIDEYNQAPYLNTDISKLTGSGRQLTGRHKDGHRFPVYLSIGEINLKHEQLFTAIIMDLSTQFQLQREIMAIPAREQRRIGEELHDGLGQQLTGLGMLAQSLLNTATKPEYELANQIATGLKDALAQVRSLSQGLMPLQIEAEGLMLALKDLTRKIEHQSNIPVHLNIDDIVLISDNTMAMHLYRIAQESLNNAIKHADASQIHVSLKIEGEHGLLEVVDDGRGVPPDLSKSNGLGVHIMKHRCGLFEGEIEIDPSEHGGTRVHCRFPLDAVIKVNT